MNTLILRLQDWLRSLAPRERWMVLVCAGVVTLTLGYLVLWEPLVLGHARREASLQSAHALAQRLETLSAKTGQSSGTAINRSISLLSAVDQSTRNGQLPRPPSRIQPEGDSEVRIWLDEVPFDALLRWTSELESRHGIRVDTAEIERTGTPGAVRAQLSLKR